MKLIAKLFLLATLALSSETFAQQPTGAQVVSSCGSKTYGAGQSAAITQDTTGALCTGSSGGGSTTSNQGAPNTAANAWPVKSTDAGGVNQQSISASGAAKVDGSAVTQPVSGSVTVQDSGGNPLQIPPGTALGANNGPMLEALVKTSAPTYTFNQINPISMTTGGALWVAQQGTATVSVSNSPTVNAQQTTAANLNAQTIALPTSAANAATSLFFAHVTNSVQAADASPGNLYGYDLFSNNTSACYIQLFNLASGSVTLGVTAPTMVIGLGPNGDKTFQSPIAMVNFNVAISIAATTTETGSTACTNGVTVDIFYK